MLDIEIIFSVLLKFQKNMSMLDGDINVAMIFFTLKISPILFKKPFFSTKSFYFYRIKKILKFDTEKSSPNQIPQKTFLFLFTQMDLFQKKTL